ncbi:HNH endonuclease [Sphingomonas alba]|uniref:HNH endonuclease n=1 Tax=Sphingomonas alba TaxID=2908208 RepID=A0ABT0RKJ0_9SPHN|nr:HNH endonuclease [Sphingomonas alba]MCL6683164.1 HNH endonuclease [Sphingomonas alba]
MAKGVFLVRADSIYDDQPEVRYQFPRQYLSRASQFVGDWIVYFEPVKAGKQGYHAVAKVERIVPDPSAESRYLALIEPGSYLPLEQAVPFRINGEVVERGVLNEESRISGRAQSAVRPLSDSDFNRIVALGLSEDGLPTGTITGVAEDQTPFDVPRDRTTLLTSRLVRDKVFRAKVLEAYDSRCALTGFKFINGGGKAEAQAAHIKPVEANGPDIVTNGIALSGTVHWMFDRGLLSLADDLTILLSSRINDVDGARKLINPSGRASPPSASNLRPHPKYLEWHRQHCFKG